MEKFNIKNGLSVGADKLDIIDATGSLSATSITLSGTAVTSTATELNYLNGVTGITLGSANEILLVGGDGSSITSDSTLAVDSASNFIGINQTSPEVTLHMTGEGAQTAQIRMEQYNDSADAPDVRTRRYRGTIDEPAAVQSGDYLFRSNHEYWNGTSLLVGGAFAFDNTNNAARTQFSVAVDTDGTGANPQGNNGQFKIDGNDSGAITFNNAYKFPTTDGSANQILQTNGAGALSFTGSPTFTGLTVDTNTLYVDAANNRIGIGTTSPAYQVEIENTGANALIVLDRTDGAACFIEGGATASVIGSVGANDVEIAYNSFPVVTIGANGAITVNPDGDGFTFPTTDGSANQILQTDGAGNLSFVDETDPVFSSWAQSVSSNYDSTYTTVQTNSARWSIVSREYQVFDASLAANEKELLFVATKPGTIHWVGAVVDDPGTEDVEISILSDGAGISGSNITLSNAASYADYGYGVTEYNSSFSAGTVIEVEIVDPGEGEGSGAVAAQGPLYIEVVLSYDD
jgi:hypothetical protein